MHITNKADRRPVMRMLFPGSKTTKVVMLNWLPEAVLNTSGVSCRTKSLFDGLEAEVRGPHDQWTPSHYPAPNSSPPPLPGRQNQSPSATPLMSTIQVEFN